MRADPPQQQAAAPLPVRVEECSDRGAWAAYVVRHPESTLYHRWIWRGVVEHVFGHETRYLIAQRGTDVSGILPLVIMKSLLFGRFLVSLPFFNYGGVLGDEMESERALLESAARIAESEHAQWVEFRHLRPRDGLAATRTHKFSFFLRLEANEETQWRALSSEIRNRIRKAQKADLTIHWNSPGALDEFYAVYSENMRDLGTPVYPRRFFERMAEVLGEDLHIGVVRTAAGRPVAANFLIGDRDTLENPWASSLRRFNALCPNNLLYWGALLRAREEGYSCFDFGRSTVGGGTYRFKQRWGATPKPCFWQYWLAPRVEPPEFNPESPRFRAATRLWSKLPLWVSRTLGPAIVRNIP